MDYTPLAERLRPQSIEEVFGQEHLTASQGFITRIFKEKRPQSILLWGPPGSGKTSIARLYAQAFAMRFHALSAVSDGIAEIKKLMKDLEDNPLFGQSALLFVDEIHRFNKAQQDALLPWIEKGTVILVGATAENPSFYLTPALLSRLRAFKLNAHSQESLQALLRRYEAKIQPLPLSPEAKNCLIDHAQGDGRYLFNLLESLEGCDLNNQTTPQELSRFLQQRCPQYDRKGDHHYDLISALHKSVRGSDPDAALYWFNRMLEGGEEPLFLARRMIRMASEDIGLADPGALALTIAAREAYQTLGSPEGELALAQAIVYLALAPKSNAVYVAMGECRPLAAATGHLNPPKTILNAPTRLLKQEGHGKGYQYDHDAEDGFSGQNYFPEGIERKEFYRPVERGFEREMKKRLEYFNRLRKEKN